MMLATFLAQAAQPAAEDPLAGLRANAAPVEVPWPSWVWWCIGAGAVVLVALLVWFGIQTALAAPDQFGLVLAGGISVWFGVQAIVHIGGVAGLLPVTGLTLPFFSAGGTSLFVSMVAAGLLLNVARRAVTTPRKAARKPVAIDAKRVVERGDRPLPTISARPSR